jgi:hypothetical protein
MAAPLLIKIKSATFKSKAIVSAQSANIGFGGSAQTAKGDGATAMQIAYVEGIVGTIAVNALQGQITDKDVIMPGNGALVIVGYQQADGEGHEAGEDKTWTFPNATLNDTSRGMPSDGNPTVDHNFTAVAASGDPSDIFSVA